MDTRFVNSSTFRLALIYMLLFGGSVLVLLGFIYWSTISYMSSQTDNTIEIDILDLTERYQNAGLAGLTQLIDERLARRPAGAAPLAAALVALLGAALAAAAVAGFIALRLGYNYKEIEAGIIESMMKGMPVIQCLGSFLGMTASSLSVSIRTARSSSVTS